MSDQIPQATITRFLKTGVVPKSREVESLVAACDQFVRARVQTDAKRAVAAGRQFAKHARRLGQDHELTALRASGWAELVAGNYREAERAYVGARGLMKSDPLSRARIDRVLIDVQMYLGHYDEARRRAQMALRTFRRQSAASDVAKTQVNYANLLHRLDRHRDASRLYGQAAEFFEAEGPAFAAALCHYNRANTLGQLFEFDTAKALYQRARRVFVKQEQQLYATGCLYGQSWLHMLEGNFQLALGELAECEAEYRRGGHARELVVCLLDRSESFLGLNLFPDARQAADEAFRYANQLGIAYERGKAQFFSAKALIGMGRTRAARSALASAEKIFRAADNPGFLAAVQLTQEMMRRGKQRSAARVKKIRRRFSGAQLPLWEALCDLEIVTRWPDDDAALKRLGHSPAVESIPHLLAARHIVHGDREARRGHMRTAVKRWTRAADILDAVRVKLPPVELRSAYFEGRHEPHIRLIDVESERDPLQGAAWSERFKTAGTWAPASGIDHADPARTRVKERLADLASRITAMQGMITDASGRRTIAAGTPSPALVRLQRQVRDGLMELKRPSTGGAESIPALARLIRKASRSQPTVQFHIGPSDIIAFVSDRGETHAHRYVEGAAHVRDWMGRWRYLIEWAAVSGARSNRDQVEEEQRLLRQLGRWLLPPLELRPEAPRLLLIPEGALAGVPWAALDDGRGSLMDRAEIVLAPSVQHHLTAQLRKGSGRTSRLFVGAHADLPYVKDEVLAVRKCFADGELEIHNPCRRTDWPVGATERVWHFAGHASLRRDNPFYSCLLLEDGPLFAVDFKVMASRVELVTLAACRTGQHTGLPGEESTGLVRSLLEMGARNIVASNWAVSDLSTSRWMDLFYDQYLGGAAPANAVRLAAQEVRERFPSAYHWSAFSLHGAG